ncbi:hypothetical protein Q5752_005806 [Cryptotrichosporon argae]
MPLDLAALHALLGQAPSSPPIASFLSALSAPGPTPAPDVKTYTDASYHNYYALGLSLCYTGSPLALDSIDIFNTPPPRPACSSSSSTSPSSPASTSAAYPSASAAPAPAPAPTSLPRAKPTYAPPPPLTLRFPTPELVLPPSKPGGSPLRLPRDPLLCVRPGSTGREIVRALGEPGRKGAGGWVGVWLEWKGVELVAGEGGREGESEGRAGAIQEGGGAEGGGDGEEPGQAHGTGPGKKSDTAARASTVFLGLMLELRDPGAGETLSENEIKRGAGGVWERAAGWTWASIKVFRV